MKTHSTPKKNNYLKYRVSARQDRRQAGCHRQKRDPDNREKGGGLGRETTHQQQRKRQQQKMWGGGGCG